MLKAFIINKVARTRFAQKAVAEKADLSAFRRKPTPKLIVGIFLIAFSYLICWPLVGVLGTLSLYWDKPLIILIGGPLVVGLSHLVFILGMALGGADYSLIFLRWAVRMLVEKHLPTKGAI